LTCLASWIQVASKPTCPLCRTPIREVITDIKGDKDYVRLPVEYLKLSVLPLIREKFGLKGAGNIASQVARFRQSVYKNAFHEGHCCSEEQRARARKTLTPSFWKVAFSSAPTLVHQRQASRINEFLKREVPIAFHVSADDLVVCFASFFAVFLKTIVVNSQPTPPLALC